MSEKCSIGLCTPVNSSFVQLRCWMVSTPASCSGDSELKSPPAFFVVLLSLPGKFCVVTLEQATATYIHVVFSVSFTSHPTIRCYTAKTVDKSSLNKQRTNILNTVLPVLSIVIQFHHSRHKSQSYWTLSWVTSHSHRRMFTIFG
jgi:hypothetical protein